MISQQTLKGNLVLQDYTTAFTLNQGDKGVPFKIKLLENGTPYTLLDTDTVSIEWLKPNGQPFLQDTGITKRTDSIEFTTPESIAQYAGTGTFNIIISDTTGRKGTIRREFKVVATSMKPGSVSEDTITDAITELQTLNTTLVQTIQTGSLNNYAKKAYVDSELSSINSELEEKVDNIQIGTRNHLLNTGLKDDTSSFVELNNEVTRVTTMKTPNGNNCFYTKLSNKTNKVWRGATQEITSGFSIGDTMTFSLWAYVTNEIATDEGFFAEVVGLASDNSTRTFTLKKQVDASDVDKWVKYELTFVIPANTVKIRCLSYVVKNGSWYTGDYKLEKGNKVSDWSPNPTDIYNAILESKKSLYPVGSLYFNATKEANPYQLLGFGTWERIAQGKTLIGVDTEDTDFSIVGKTGGSKTHTHSSGSIVANIGAIADDLGKIGYIGTTPQATSYGMGVSGAAVSDVSTKKVNHATTTSGNTSNASSLQPYITVYIWKRTA